MKNRIVSLMAALALCATLSPAKAGQILGVLEIRGIDNLASTVFDLSKAVGQPVPKEMVSLGIYGVLGSMPGMGIEPNGTLRALWLESDAEMGTVAILLPVENDGDAYLASLGQSGWTSLDDTGDGLLHFSAPAQTFIPWRDVYFLKSGSTLVAARSADDARSAGAALANLPPILPAEGVVVKQIRPAALIEAFYPQIAESMDKAFQAAPGDAEDAVAMGQLYLKGYLAVGRQVDEIVLGLGVADGNLNVHTRVAPVADSRLAKWMATLQAPSAAAAAVNLPGALFVETANLGDTSLIAQPYFRYMEEMIKLMPEEVAALSSDAYLDGVKKYWEQLAGDFGIALLPPTKDNPLRLAEFLALKDSSAVRGLATQMMGFANDMMKNVSALDSAAPVAFELVLGEPREYRGIPVDSVSYSIKPGDALQASWPFDGALNIQAEMAWAPNGVLVGVGGADITEMLVDRALDGAGSPVSDLPAWKAFYPAAEPHSVDLTHVAMFDAIRAYLGLVDEITGDETVQNVPDGPGHLSSLSYVAMDGLMSRVRFSLSDIAAIVAKTQEAQQKAMADRQAQMEAFEVDMSDDDSFDFDSIDEDETEWISDDSGETETDSEPIEE